MSIDNQLSTPTLLSADRGQTPLLFADPSTAQVFPFLEFLARPLRWHKCFLSLFVLFLPFVGTGVSFSFSFSCPWMAQVFHYILCLFFSVCGTGVSMTFFSPFGGTRTHTHRYSQTHSRLVHAHPPGAMDPYGSMPLRWESIIGI